jgi:hypothetical protein
MRNGLTPLTSGNIFLPSAEVLMSIVEIQTALLEVLQEVQKIRGRTWTELTLEDIPMEDLDGFDSLTSVESTVMVEEKLECGELGIASIFVSEDNKKALTIREATIRIKDILEKNGKER